MVKQPCCREDKGTVLPVHAILLNAITDVICLENLSNDVLILISLSSLELHSKTEVASFDGYNDNFKFAHVFFLHKTQ